MADIITYPENGITYDADDASGYLSTRLSGVYSADEDFAVTANSDLTVTVSAGQAWVRPARFRGRSIIMEQPATLTLTAADTTRTRIDRVVLRYDAAAKKTSLAVLTGTPDSASPTAPEITRTALVYDLCLADIRRPAGSTVVTAADITDTRADEDVCGVMRDSVTGIPTAQLLEQWQAAQAQQDAEARQAAAEMLRTAQEQITAQLDRLQQQADDLKTAIDNVESGSFYTKSEVDALVKLYALPAATTSTLGGVKVGSGLSVTGDGTLSADAQEYSLPTASHYTLGGIRIGSNLSMDSYGRVSAPDPYTLPTATAYRLGGVKVGDYLDITADGTLSAKTLNDKIAAAVAVKSEPRLVWNYHTKSPTKWKTYDVSIPDGVDYVHIKTKCDTYTGAEFDLVRGGNTSHVFDTTPAEVVCTMTFQADGTLHVQGPYRDMSYSYAIELWLSGYHYPTLEDLMKEGGV